MGRNVLQLINPALGTKIVRPYTNLFMGHPDETIQKALIWSILLRKRLIDNILLIFLGPTNQVQS